MLSKSSSNLEAQIFYTSGINKLFPLGKHAIVPTFINKVVLQPRYKDLYEIRGLKGFPCGSAGKESTYNAGDPSTIPGSGRFPVEGLCYALQCFGASLVAQTVKNLPAMQETWV